MQQNPHCTFTTYRHRIQHPLRAGEFSTTGSAPLSHGGWLIIFLCRCTLGTFSL